MGFFFFVEVTLTCYFFHFGPTYHSLLFRPVLLIFGWLALLLMVLLPYWGVLEPQWFFTVVVWLFFLFF